MPYVAKSFIRQHIKDSNKKLHKYLVRNLCKVLPKIFVAFLLEIRKLLVYILGKPVPVSARSKASGLRPLAC